LEVTKKEGNFVRFFENVAPVAKSGDSVITVSSDSQIDVFVAVGRIDVKFDSLKV
jgi:hypothetical protein